MTTEPNRQSPTDSALEAIEKDISSRPLAQASQLLALLVTEIGEQTADMIEDMD